MPRKRPREKLGTSQGHPGRLADLCGNSNSRGRTSAGQTGHMTGQMGRVPRDRRDTHQGVSHQNSFCLLVFLSPLAACECEIGPRDRTPYHRRGTVAVKADIAESFLLHEHRLSMSGH